MSPAMTDLMHQLQDVHTDHPDDEWRLIVAVPTRRQTVEHFEVGEVQHDGPSVVLHCRPLQEEPAKPEVVEKKRACVHNDYEDLC